MAKQIGRRLALVLAAALLLAACGEPAVPLDVPARSDDQAVLDLAGVLDANDPELHTLVNQLRAVDWDVVVVTFEDDEASLGLTDRVGRKVIDEWDVDIALVAVAEPGDFSSTDAQRRRFFGLSAKDIRSVSGGLREKIAEQLAPPIAADNRWIDVFKMALRELLAARSGS